MGKLLFLAFAILSLVEVISTGHIVCYHGTWSQYRSGNGQFSISATPTDLCTHYIYTFVGLDGTTNKVTILDKGLAVDQNGFSDAVGLKKQNPNLKVLVAIGGWGEGSGKYSVMAANPSSRAVFIDSILNLVQTYNFDGLDLDWEYPSKRDSWNPADKTNFGLLVKELRARFLPLGLLLTAAVSATPSSVATSYDVPVLSQNLDIINIMTYDFHGSWDRFTSHNSPLYSSARLGTTYAEFSIDASIKGWIAAGADPAKLTVGIPFYGRNFILSSSSNTAPGASTTGSGAAAGPYTGTPGFWGYNEIVELFNEGGWTQGWDNEQQVSYAYKGTTWLSYDNPASVALKVQYAQSHNLGGVIIWSIETDDTKGVSGTKFPLLTAINNAFGKSSSDSSSSTQSSTSSVSSTTTSTKSSTSSVSSSSSSSTTSTTSSPSSSTFTCTAAGYFRDSSNCNKYYYCQATSSTTYVKHNLQCGNGLYYDTSIGNCNWSYNVSC